MTVRLLNDPLHAVDDMIDGVLATHDAQLMATANRRGIARSGVAGENRVKVISGGGSGHEPAFWGLIGDGMLDGVAVGNVFAAPAAADAAAVADLAGPDGGVLFVYGNYQGDRLNFGLAARTLTGRGVPCEQVLITDDVASAPAADHGNRRGVAGSVFVFRLAAAAARAGYDLPGVARIAAEANRATRTIGVALSGCTLPGAADPSFTVASGQVELGMGVHGEAGLSRIGAEPVAKLAQRMIDLLLGDGASGGTTNNGTTGGTGTLDDAPPAGDGTTSDGGPGAGAVRDAPYCLINLAGSTPLLEGYVLAREVHASLGQHGIRPRQTLVGPYLTTLDMAGASVTLFTPTAELTTLLATGGACVAGLPVPGGVA